MYILEAKISNVRSIESLTWSVPREKAAGWHVILGDNGAGKSTVLKALALGLLGPENASALRLPWENWVRRGKGNASITLEVEWDEIVDANPGINQLKFLITRVDLPLEASESEAAPLFRISGENPGNVKRIGNFSAGYGPFRRFSGGDQEYDSLVRTYTRVARHLSLFDERVALTECLKWLRQLKFQQLEKRERSNGEQGQDFLDDLIRFINQEGFLPFGVRLHEITSEAVLFIDGNGCDVRVEEMSDGYRSILSMTFELIRQLSNAYRTTTTLISSGDSPKILVPGIVLIDEADAHLHPTWQRRIGLWFRQHFPNIQFIVTTHSPLVCQAAEVGTVFRLPAPGSAEEPHRVEGHELDRLLYGDILDAYGTGLFGQGITRSASSQKRLERLAALNLKEIDEGLSEQEEEEQESLRAALPTAAHVLSVEDAADS